MLKTIRANQNKKPAWLWPVLAAALVRLVYGLRMEPYSALRDTYSYIEFPIRFTPPHHVEIINGRVPVYPLLLGLCQRLSGGTFDPAQPGNPTYLLLAGLQILVSLVSLVFFYKACSLLVKNRRVVGFVTLAYGCAPAVMGWDTVILTESLALSGTVFFIYLLLRYLQTPSFGLGAGAVVLLFVLTFLRPSFLLFDGILLAFWLLRMLLYPQERRLLCKLTACSLAAFAVMAGYSAVFSRTFEIFSISDPMPRQLAKVCIDRGYYLQSDDDAFIATVEEGLAGAEGDTWPATELVLERFGLKETARLAKECIRADLPAYGRDTWGVVAAQSYARFYGYGIPRPDDQLPGRLLVDFADTVDSLFNVFTGAHLYLILCAELVALAVQWVRTKQLPWVHLGLAGFLLAIPLSTVLATCDEYMRTMLCVLPFLYLSCALFLGWLTGRPRE